MFTKNPTQTDL